MIDFRPIEVPPYAYLLVCNRCGSIVSIEQKEQHIKFHSDVAQTIIKIMNHLENRFSNIDDFMICIMDNSGGKTDA